jgi:hypothetical protein
MTIAIETLKDEATPATPPATEEPQGGEPEADWEAWLSSLRYHANQGGNIDASYVVKLLLNYDSAAACADHNGAELVRVAHILRETRSQVARLEAELREARQNFESVRGSLQSASETILQREEAIRCLTQERDEARQERDKARQGLGMWKDRAKRAEEAYRQSGARELGMAAEYKRLKKECAKIYKRSASQQESLEEYLAALAPERMDDEHPLECIPRLLSELTRLRTHPPAQPAPAEPGGLRYERAAAIPPLVKALCHGHGAWLVGSAARYIAGETDIPPGDWDVIVPFHEWRKACRLIPKGTPANSFGGSKANIDGVLIDLWPQGLGEYLVHASDDQAMAVHPETRRVVRVKTGWIYRQPPAGAPEPEGAVS